MDDKKQKHAWGGEASEYETSLVSPAKSEILKTSKVLEEDKQAKSTALGQDKPAMSTLLGQDKPAKYTEPEQVSKRSKNKDDDFLTRMLQEHDIEARATERGQSQKPTNILSSGDLGHQDESQGSIIPQTFTAQGPFPDAKALDKHTTEIAGSATKGTDENQQDFIRKSVETMIELCRSNGESYMAQFEDVKRKFIFKSVETMNEICRSNQRFCTAQIEDVKRMMKENDNTQNQQKIKEFIFKSVDTMNEICRTNGENYTAQIEDVRRMMEENDIKQNEQNIKFQRDKDKRHILTQLNGVLQRRIRNLQTMKDDFLLKFGQLGTTSDRERCDVH